MGRPTVSVQPPFLPFPRLLPQLAGASRIQRHTMMAIRFTPINQLVQLGRRSANGDAALVDEVLPVLVFHHWQVSSGGTETSAGTDVDAVSREIARVSEGAAAAAAMPRFPVQAAAVVDEARLCRVLETLPILLQLVVIALGAHRVPHMLIERFTKRAGAGSQ